MPGRANSAYASSTTTRPGAAAQTASIAARPRAVPVGLFGEVRNTTSGCSRRMCAAAWSASRPKSGSRAAGIHRVPVVFAISGCMEYDGSKPVALRPGPPYAWSSCWITSLEPLAAHSCGPASPWPR